MFNNSSSMSQFLRRPRVDDLFSRGRQRGNMGMSHIPEAEEDTMQEPDNRTPGQRFVEEIMKLHTNKGKSTSAYEEHLQNLPDAEKHKPGWFTRVAAGLSGLGAGARNPGEGIAVARDVNRGSYDRAMEEYYNKAKTLGSAAELERRGTADQIEALKYGHQSGLSWEKFLEEKRKNEHQRGIDEGKLSVDQARAEAYIESVRNPGFDYMPQTDGSVLQINKRSGERQLIPADDVRSFSARTSASIGFGNLNARNRGLDQADEHHDETLEFNRGKERNRVYDAKKTRELQQRALDLRREISRRGGQNSPRDLRAARDLALEMIHADGLEGVESTDGGFYQLESDAPAITKQALEAKIREILGRE